MERIMRRIDTLVDSVKEWDGIEAITNMEFLADDTYDPYFFISLDIYYSGTVPDFETRRASFPDAVAFESSRAHLKDRFLLKDIPVRLEYKKMPKYADMVTNFGNYEQLYRSSGTYGLYRIEKSAVLYDKEGKFDELKKTVTRPEDDFWQFLFSIFQGTTVHFLGDLKAAALKSDQYFFLFSSSGFMHNLARLLYTLNKRFECSGRQVYTDAFTLKNVPENFKGRFQTFLRPDGGISIEKKAEVAELLTTSVIGMEYILQ